jgi:peptide/nickel transport system permease protein
VNRERDRMLRNKKIKESLTAFFSNRWAVFGVCLLSLFLLMAYVGPLFYHYDHAEFFLSGRVAPPEGKYVLGFDELGRDVLGAVIHGARASLKIGLFVTLIVAFIGSVLGISAGYFGGLYDTIIMRITEAFMMVPSLPLMLVLAAIVGQKFSNIIWILGLTGWTGTARLVRAQTLSVKQRNYVERARAIGASEIYVMYRHILPNVFPLIFAQLVLTVQNAILSEATLAFLGIGDPSIPTWGQLLRSAREQGAILTGAWWLFIPAGICIVLLASSFVFIGYGFDEILNPRLRRR